SGTLQSVTDPLGQTVSFGVNARRELTQVTRPGQVNETRTYWPDGAIATQTVRDNSLSQDWRTASFDYDWQGSLSSRRDGARGELFGARYSALGHLLSMADTTTLGATNVTKSSDSVDAYGNAYKSDGLTNQNNIYANKNSYYFSSSVGGAAVRKYQAGTGRLTQTTTNGGTDVYLYDLSGNVEFLGQLGYTGNFTNSTAQHESRYSYYDAGNRLRFADYRMLSGTSTYLTAFEEYRYDALGRRVLVWGRLSCVGLTVSIGQVVSAGSPTSGSVDVSPTCSSSFARRVVWDGNQELWEIQAPSTAVGGSLVENDVNPITTGLSLTGASQYADPYMQYGLTAYTFGPELDRPVSVIRANWVGAYTPLGSQTGPLVTSPMAFYPHYLDAGQPYRAAFADGQEFQCVGTGNAKRCLTPDVNFRADFLPWAQGSYVESAWLGSLLSDKQDKTLTFYRRNRVYDPLTRQFTQEDPIGLAGGLNAYGFAGGDPVNFSDPFGLKLVFRGKDRAELETSYQLGLIALRIGAERGDKLAAFYLRAITGLDKDPNRIIVIESGRTKDGGLGETEPSGNQITIDVKGTAREMNTRPSLLLLHELGHAFGIGTGRLGGGEGEALEVENAARRALGFTERSDHGTYPPIEQHP
ncbi:MAG TPA: RHS repeat-associated core domain-containing protein, partial [Gemmatimonadaceae bacterium]